MLVPFHTTDGVIDLAELTLADVAAEAIAGALSKINRFNGRTQQPWSVAVHSLLVEAMCQDETLKGWALLHDAHEAFLGDITTPAFEYICLAGSGTAVTNALHNAKGKLDRVIGAAWECAPRAMNLAIRRADWLALQAEMQVFFNVAPTTRNEDDLIEIAKARQFITQWRDRGWGWARRSWIARAEELADMGLLTLPRPTNPTSTMLAG